MQRLTGMLLLSVFPVLAASCSRTVPPTEAPPRAAVEKPGLHNVLRITDKLYSGSSPDGDVGFRSLQELGVRTVLSVDGARPDVERAQRFGMRYVHLPIGYDGISEAQARRIAKAVRDLPGPVYLHCHHGKHRGPAAAAVAHLCLEDKCSAAQAVDDMLKAGTDPRYTGLYAAPRQLRRPTKEDLDRLPSDFPEVAPVAALTTLMVEVDDRWEGIKKIQAAGWKVPAAHPDLDPPHEVLQLREHFREAGRLDTTKDRPVDFRQWLAESEQAAAELEQALRPKPDNAAAEKAFGRLKGLCSRCHAKYRDEPRR